MKAITKELQHKMFRRLRSKFFKLKEPRSHRSDLTLPVQCSKSDHTIFCTLHTKHCVWLSCQLSGTNKRKQFPENGTMKRIWSKEKLFSNKLVQNKLASHDFYRYRNLLIMSQISSIHKIHEVLLEMKNFIAKETSISIRVIAKHENKLRTRTNSMTHTYQTKQNTLWSISG